MRGKRRLEFLVSLKDYYPLSPQPAPLSFTKPTPYQRCSVLFRHNYSEKDTVFYPAIQLKGCIFDNTALLLNRHNLGRSGLYATYSQQKIVRHLRNSR